MFYDRVGIPGRQGKTPTRPAQQAPQQTQPQGFYGPTANLFAQYMSQLFNQKYAPPMMQGSPLRNMGGFYGFQPQQMAPIQRAPQQPVNPYMGGQPVGGNGFWDFQGGAPGM